MAESGSSTRRPRSTGPDSATPQRGRRSAASATRAGYIPVDAEAERAVLGALLTRPDAFFEVSELLDPSDFGVFAHGEVYRAIVACDAQGRPFDVITVADQLRRSKMLSKVGRELLDDLANESSQPGNVLAHAAIIADKALLRRLHNAGLEISTAATDTRAEPSEVLGTAESAVFSLSQTKRRSSLKDMPQVVAEMMHELAEGHKSLLPGVSTGFSQLDKVTGGLQEGKLYLLGARPSMGKSALAVQIARHVAEVEPTSAVAVFSYEMASSEISFRMLGAALGYSSHRIRAGDVPQEMERDIAVAAERMAALGLVIDDSPPATISGLASSCRRLARRAPLALVVVDYLQLMSSDRYRNGDNRVAEVGDVSRGLKLLAGELNCPILACSQLSRQLENRQNKRPVLADLRESGNLEQDADLVAFLYRDFVYNESEDQRAAELIIAKQRAGALATIPLLFEGDRGPRFISIEAGAGGVPRAAGGSARQGSQSGRGRGGGWF